MYSNQTKHNMEKIKNKAWVVTPNINLVTLGLEIKDILTYITIRSFINTDTKECFPAIRTIAAKGDLDPVFIGKSLARLVKAGLLTVVRNNVGKSNHYIFSEVKLFKSIPTDILGVKGLTASERALLVCIRQFFKDEGFTSLYWSIEMAGKLGLDSGKFRRKYDSLLKKGYLSQKLTVMKLKEGLESKQIITLNCDMFDWQVKIENKLSDHDHMIEALNKKVAFLEKLLLKSDSKSSEIPLFIK